MVPILTSLNARDAYGHLISKRCRVAAPRTLEHQDDLVIAAGMHGMRFQVRVDLILLASVRTQLTRLHLQDRARHVSLVQSPAGSGDRPQVVSSDNVGFESSSFTEADHRRHLKPQSTKRIEG